MKLRLIGGALWVYAAWYAWSMYAGLAGINPLMGPLVAAMGLAFVAAAQVRRSHQRDRAEHGEQIAVPPVHADLL